MTPAPKAEPEPSGRSSPRWRRPRSAPPSRWLAWTLAFALAALAVPSLVAPIPPLTDYPNNLARFWLLTHALDPPMPGVFAVQWDTLTNLGTDVLSLLLARIAGVELAARIIALLGVLIVPVGGVLLWRALYGRWHWWPIAFGLLAWSFELLDGFLNFRFGLGLALLAAALEASRPRHPSCGPGSRPGWRTALLRLLSGAVILLFHPFGFVFYGVLLFGLALGPHPARRAWRGNLAALLAAAAALAVPLGLFLALSPRLPGDTAGLRTGLAELAVGLPQAMARPGSKLVGVATALRSYSNLADALAVACLVLPLAAAGAAGRLRIHAGLLVGAAGCLLAYLLCPSALAGADWVDRRFVCMIPLLLAASLRPDLPPRPALACALLLLLGSLFRTGYVATAWHERQPDFASVARTLAHVPAGAAVFAVEHRPAASFDPPLGRYLVGRRIDLPPCGHAGDPLAPRLRSHPVRNPRPAAGPRAAAVGKPRHGKRRQPRQRARARPAGCLSRGDRQHALSGALARPDGLHARDRCRPSRSRRTGQPAARDGARHRSRLHPIVPDQTLSRSERRFGPRRASIAR